MKLAYSSCPNDTYIFHAIKDALIDRQNFSFEIFLHDIQELNQYAKEGKYEITKLSFAALYYLSDKYEILDSGAALGKGCGPLLVANKNFDIKNIKNAKIAIPGFMTTAYFLLCLYLQSKNLNCEFLRFDKIMPACKSGEYDAGLIIHEGRFTYEKFNLQKIIDLGDWWEKTFNLPIVLGAIAIKKEHKRYKKDIEDLIRKSIIFANDNPLSSKEYIKENAQEMSDDVIAQHIKLYVNDFSISLGENGKAAIDKFFKMAKVAKL